MQNGFPKKLYLDNDLAGLPSQAEQLFEQQTTNWQLASSGYQSLAEVQTRKFEFDSFEIEAHFNPGRIISSSAKVDAKSIEARPCFLCIDNLPEEQKAVKIVNDYILLVNPFPIFSRHFTIPLIKHLPQAIESEIGNLLSISSLLGKDYTVFYNGPRCGASAPDHMHFQAGNFGFMQIDNGFNSIQSEYGKKIFEDRELSTTAITGCLRNFFSVESGSILRVIDEVNRIYNVLKDPQSAEEPMMNIICSYDEVWRLLIFPRSKHRPTYFFAEGNDKILISPAAVDLGGVCIFPREEDFSKVTKELIIDIFEQVTLDINEFDRIVARLRNK